MMKEEVKVSKNLMGKWEALHGLLASTLAYLNETDLALPQGGTLRPHAIKFVEIIEEMKTHALITETQGLLTNLQLALKSLKQESDDEMTPVSDILELVSAYNRLKTYLQSHMKMELVFQQAVEEQRQDDDTANSYIQKFSINNHTRSLTMLKNRLVNGYLDSDEADKNTVLQAFSSGLIHAKTWDDLKDKLGHLAESLNPHGDSYKHNQLAVVLNPDPDVFISQVSGKSTSAFVFDSGELGYLALGRVLNLMSQRNMTQHKRALNHAFDENKFVYGKTLFYVDNLQLKNEVMKLLLHARRNPKHKIIWLGTAKSVIEYSRNHPSEGIYLNCDDDKWTWSLNRLYLLIASEMGFSFKLVERQFPNIETAILSGNASALLLELFRQAYPCGNSTISQKTSQYDGGDQPTATALECLALLDFGCTAVCEENEIVFTRKIPLSEPTSRPFRVTHLQRLRRSNSHANLNAYLSVRQPATLEERKKYLLNHFQTNWAESNSEALRATRPIAPPQAQEMVGIVAAHSYEALRVNTQPQYLTGWINDAIQRGEALISSMDIGAKRYTYNELSEEENTNMLVNVNNAVKALKALQITFAHNELSENDMSHLIERCDEAIHSTYRELSSKNNIPVSPPKRRKRNT